MTRKDKIQHLLITHLMENGQISLTLPTGIIVDIGCTQETKRGTEKNNQNSWVSTTQNERALYMDQYNLTLQYPGNPVVMEEKDNNGVSVHVLDVV